MKKIVYYKVKFEGFDGCAGKPKEKEFQSYENAVKYANDSFAEFLKYRESMGIEEIKVINDYERVDKGFGDYYRQITRERKGHVTIFSLRVIHKSIFLEDA